MDEEDGFEVVQTLGAWTIRSWWPTGATGGPQRLTIEAQGEASPREVARGISTTVLRRLDLAGAISEAQKAAPSAESTELVQLGAASKALLAEEGVSPAYLASLSLTYKTVADSGITAPIPWLAESIGRQPETIKDQLKRARREGFLTTIAGKAGGELTKKSLELLTPTPDRRSNDQGQ